MKDEDIEQLEKCITRGVAAGIGVAVAVAGLITLAIVAIYRLV